jgi:histidyl-tRNA synthetase
MKYADKLGARFTAVIGGEEIEKKKITLKNMQNGETASLSMEAAAIYGGVGK